MCIRGSERPHTAPGAQAHVHTVKEALRRGAHQGINQMLAEGLIIGRVITRNEQQINVGTVVQLFAAQFAQRNDDEAIGRLICAPGRQGQACLLYTSDAADERSSVDLGGRRIIKKKK